MVALGLKIAVLDFSLTLFIKSELLFKRFAPVSNSKIFYFCKEPRSYPDWTRTHNHLVHKRTLNHLAKLAGFTLNWLDSLCGFTLKRVRDMMRTYYHIPNLQAAYRAYFTA